MLAAAGQQNMCPVPRPHRPGSSGRMTRWTSRREPSPPSRGHSAAPRPPGHGGLSPWPAACAHRIDVLIETAVAQRGAPWSENRRRVGNTLGVMFQGVRQARKRNGGSWLYRMIVGHNYRPPLPPEAEDLDRRPNTCFHIVIVGHVGLSLLEPIAHVHLTVHRHRGGEVFAGLLRFEGAAVEPAQAEVALGDERAHAV